MSIRSVLRHRATVRRGVLASGSTAWSEILSEMPCLLDAGEAQSEPSWTQEQQRQADRTGLFFTLPNSGVKPGDRIVMTRGASGTFVVKPDPAARHLLNEPSHAEWRVEEVPSGA